MIYEKNRLALQKWVSRGIVILTIAAVIEWNDVTGPIGVFIYIVFELAVLQDLPAKASGQNGYSRMQKIEIIVGLIVMILLIGLCFYRQELTDKMDVLFPYPLIATPADGN